jgi:anti-sigma B factor antagonist
VETQDGWGEPLAESDLPEAQGFGTRCSERDGVIWLALSGELDVFTAPLLRRSFDEAMPADGETLVLDLRGLSFLDSSGLAVLLGIHERLSQSQADLRIIITGSVAVESLFETIGAADYLPLIDDPDKLIGVDGS